MRDVTAGALARRDIAGAIQLLEQERERGFVNINDVLQAEFGFRPPN